MLSFGFEEFYRSGVFLDHGAPEGYCNQNRALVFEANHHEPLKSTRVLVKTLDNRTWRQVMFGIQVTVYSVIDHIYLKVS